MENHNKSIAKHYEIWDVHTHIGKDKDRTTISLKHWLKEMSESGISKAVAFPLNDPFDQSFKKPNTMIYSHYKKHPKKLIPFFRLNPKRNFEEEFNKRYNQEFKGIKLHPRSQKFRMNSKEAMMICEMAEKYELPMIVHTGYSSKGEEIKYIVDDILDVKKEFKNLKIILGHSSFVDIENALKKFKKIKNIYFEFSTLKFVDIAEIILRIDNKRILFGSDTPYRRAKHYVECFMFMIDELKMSEKLTRMIFSENLKKVLGVDS